MNLKKCCLLFLSCTFFFLSAGAQEKYSKVKIPVTSPVIKNFVFNNLSLDHYSHDGNAFVVVLNSSEMNRLRQSGFPFELLIDDVVKYTTDLNRDAAPVNNAAPFQITTCQKIG